MGACNAFYSFGLDAMACLLLLVVLLGTAHVDRPHRILACSRGVVGYEKHLVFGYTALASLRYRYAGLFMYSTDTMSSFVAQPDHVRVFLTE